MRNIELASITDKIAELALEANVRLRPDVLASLKAALSVEESPMGRRVLEQLIENAKIALESALPICQDTGIVTVYVKLGRDARIEGDLFESVQEGVRRAYLEGYLRKSIIRHPALGVENTGDNTPAAVEIEMVDGDSVDLTVMPKGGGSENVSSLKMLPVSGGLTAIEGFVLEVAAGSAAACPPLILGVGIGGNFADVAGSAKRALLRRIDDRNKEPRLADLEERLLKRVNGLGIGPAGLGGRVTALAVKVEERSCHIACLPVAVSVSCHALRSASGTVVPSSTVVP
ncbi:MAG: fumarate hydratase [Actinobacteria bacterium]|nr:fumarate hydratase [Actinomycetota bacterium]